MAHTTVTKARRALFPCCLVAAAMASGMNPAGAQECSTSSHLFVDGRPAVVAMMVDRGRPRLSFVANADGGTSTRGGPSSAERCRRAGHVRGGDVVLAAQHVDGFVCAVYTAPGSGQTTEDRFLPSDALVTVPPSTLDGADWAGIWVRRTAGTRVQPWAGDLDRIAVTSRGDGRLDIHGSAAPEDRGSVQTAKMVLTGEFDVLVQPAGAELAFSVAADGKVAPFDAAGPSLYSPVVPCRLRLARVGPYLIVHDNVRCADGVSFSGAYRRG